MAVHTTRSLQLDEFQSGAPAANRTEEAQYLGSRHVVMWDRQVRAGLSYEPMRVPRIRRLATTGKSA